MAKFIDLTESDDQSVMVNVDNIIFVRPGSDDDGTMIYVTSPGQNDCPVSLWVKESYVQVARLIQR